MSYKPYKIYLASHFFNRGGYLETDMLAEVIREFFDEDEVELYIPQRNDSINEKDGEARLVTDEDIANADMKELASSDMVIANCDGVEIDSGVAGEIMGAAMFNMALELSNNEGASCPRKTLVGYTTDMRVNPVDAYFIDDIKELLGQSKIQETIDLIENEKANHLYRNRMIIGIIKLYGTMITGQADNDNYIKDIIIEINKHVGKYDYI